MFRAFGDGTLAVLKPVLPHQVGLLMVNGVPHGLGGAFDSVPAGGEVLGGLWVIPLFAALGLGVLVLTHRGATKFLRWWRARSRRLGDTG